ncbi:MAG TPA: cyclic pyranopterin monophosphate synthase MoaC [Pyrodictium delaneyi]|uniref:Cyclic pyranopterin monophosphate synthase MoaC n=1 Tax=Pyrodictium delaneyi TaxID=1273541 RepID=A0A832ZT48_9CREN|nr:cyclic pyranopterin monophosphate synthase MoaC [Pyrodictium delaneyi]
MVDISQKPTIYREATAYGRIKLRKSTIEAIKKGLVEKGDPLFVAAIAGIQAVKMTPQLLPMCHPIEITNADVKCFIEDDSHIGCRAKVRAIARTGVEMEALTAVSIALLNIWDMVKKIEKDEHGLYPETAIEKIIVEEKVKTELK